MRNNSLVAALVGVLFVCELFTTWLSVRYYFSTKQLQKLQAQVLIINGVRNAALSLANDSLEYSRRNAAILPLLQQFQVVPRPSLPPGAGPATPKPPGK